jgi:hypothetical protein
MFGLSQIGVKRIQALGLAGDEKISSIEPAGNLSEAQPIVCLAVPVRPRMERNGNVLAGRMRSNLSS